PHFHTLSLHDALPIFRDHVLRPAGDDRVVLFAQPIETVTAFAHYLERTYGVRPAVIVGGQTDQVRQEEIDRFWRPNGPQFLVSRSEEHTSELQSLAYL